MNSAFLANSLSLRILLERPKQPMASLSPALLTSLPVPLQKGHLAVHGPVVTVGTPREAAWEDSNKLGKRVAAAYKKSKTKPAPLQQFFDDVEGWLLKLHEAHPIALATVSWHPWIGEHARPTPSASHAAALESPPSGALAVLADLVNDANDDASKEVRQLVTSTMFYLSDCARIFDDVAADVALQRLFAHAWSAEENGATLRLLGARVSDDVIESVAAHAGRLQALVRARGFGVGDKHNVQTVATPMNAVWGIISRLRLFALSEPMRPSMFFERDADAFFVREASWGIDENVGGTAVCEFGAAAAFMACHQRMTLSSINDASAANDATFRQRFSRAIRWERTATFVDSALSWA